MKDPNDDDGATPLLTPTEALALVSSFFTKEWARCNENDIYVQRVTGGLINTLHLVRRSTPGLLEPSAVLIRHFGQPGENEEPQDDGIALSAAQQALVYWEMGRRGWGPKTYGLFASGRVEEWIEESRTLTAAEAGRPEIAKGVARAYARFHSLEVPLRRDGFRRVVQKFSASAEAKREMVLETLRGVDDPRAQAYAIIFRETDWSAELAWITSLFAKHNCKTTLTHGDANYLNILVKHTAPPEIMLIDYETTSFQPRAFDLGGHFNERQYVYNNPSTQLTGYPAPSRAEQELFCSAYLQELRSLGVTLYACDTVEHLMLEVQIGRMYQLLFTNLMCTVFDEDVEDDPVFLEGLGHTMGCYRQLKEKFAREHGS